MIDTTDLTSYLPGYDEYCEPKETIELYDKTDEAYEEMMLVKKWKIMERQEIDLEEIGLSFEEAMALEDYVLHGNKLTPAELLEGE